MYLFCLEEGTDENTYLDLTLNYLAIYILCMYNIVKAHTIPRYTYN